MNVGAESDGMIMIKLVDEWNCLEGNPWLLDGCTDVLAVME